MRLDKYLKISRIIKRRTVANEVCDAKHVTVNGKVARASYDVKVGDVIESTKRFGVCDKGTGFLNVQGDIKIPYSKNLSCTVLLFLCILLYVFSRRDNHLDAFLGSEG
mgnify:CR=1 FL=1